MSLSLTREQEQVVNLRDGSYLVLAPPGTGKTEVIAHRIVRLLAAGELGSFRVLALTFNVMAASAMRSRVRAELEEGQVWRATIETYHSFFLDILRHYGHLIGVPAEVTVYDSIDARIHALNQGLLDDGYILADLDLGRPKAIEILDEISTLKRSLISPGSDKGLPRFGGNEISLRAAYAAYEGALRRNGAVDFDGMLTRCHELLSDHPEVAEHYRKMYRYILIDEAQDTSMVQFEILRLICGETHRNVLMVADPDQLINGWMGADRRNLERFVTEFGAQTLRLRTNFRCADSIVRTANALLAASGTTDRSIILPAGTAEGWISAEQFPDEGAEAAAVVDWIVGLRDGGLDEEWLADGESGRVAPSEIAVLARTRFQLALMVAELERRREVFTFRTGDAGPFDSEPYRLLLAAMRVLSNPRDRALRRGLLGSVGKELENLVDIDRLVDSDLDDFLGEVAELASFDSRALLLVLRPSGDVTAVMSRLAELSPNEQYEADSEYAELLRLDGQLLADRWLRYGYETESRYRSWHGVTAALLSEPKGEGDGFRVSTVHAAKGLEFRAVALVAMNEGSFPDFRNVANSEDLSAERRLAYVALTRASRAVLVTRSRIRSTSFGNKVQEPSRFIADMNLVMRSAQ